MFEFQKYTITTKIQQTQLHVKNLKECLQKMKQNQQQLQVQSIERVNKVALFNVILTKTSEFTIKLNKDYFTKVKYKTAINLIQTKIKHYKQEIKKWEQLKSNLNKKKGMRQPEIINQGGQRSGVVQAIGVNEEGQQIFNIVQYSDGDSISKPALGRDHQLESKLNVIPESIQQEEGTKSNTTTEQKKKEIKQQQLPQQKVNRKSEQVISIQEKPKKISKFKADRMQMKDK